MTSHSQEILTSLAGVYPKHAVRKHSLVVKATTKARTIKAKLDRLKNRAGPTKSEPSDDELADGNTGRGEARKTNKAAAGSARKTDKALAVQVVAHGALAHAAKVREGLDCLPTMNRGRVYTQLLSESPSLGLCFVLFMLEYIGRRGRWRCIETAEHDGFEGRDKVRRLSVR